MGRSSSGGLRLVVAIIFLCSIGACGGHRPPGQPGFPTRINLIPNGNTSFQVGSIFTFSATALNSNNTTVAATFTFTSSDTSILNIAPGGVACAGHWDAFYTTCTPGGIGVVQVTAVSQGVYSAPTFVFVHPTIDNIIVTGILLDNVAIQEPCLSQGQTMTVQAQAFSQGTDVTSSVGPFTWSAQNPTVVKITPLVNIAYNFPTNQATVTAVTPGITQIIASASGAFSNSFQQPPPGTNLKFFETCPIQNISLELNHAGSGQTSFLTTKASTATETVVATLTDSMGNTSLPNTDGGVVLSKIPLTWTASKPGVIAPGSGCGLTCNLSIPLQGSGTVTASCAPPTCNIGFPEVPAGITAPYIPYPVYATTAISGVVTGGSSTPPSSTVLAGSTGCADVPPATCITAIYSVNTSKAVTGNPNFMAGAPNSMLFDLAGDKAYVGSDFGIEVINPGNLNSSNSAVSTLAPITGTVLATSTNGNIAAFSDTIHTPNQVYIVDTTSAQSTGITALNIAGGTAAAFSPDALKTFIIGDGGSSLYIYSTLQALQGPSENPQLTLSGSGNAVAFSPNGAFAFVSEASGNSGSANLTAFHNCNDLVAGSVPLSATPILMRVLPGVHINGTDSYGNTIPDGIHIFVLDATGFDIVTAAISAPPVATLTNPSVLCPQDLTFVSNDHTRPAQRIEFGQGTIHPINFFASADGSLLYVLASDRSSILVYNFATASWGSGIQLLQTGSGNVTPVSADMTVDGTTIVVAGSDGMLHQVSTALGGSDQVQLPFPYLPDVLNPFCNNSDSSAAPCTLNVVIARP